MYMKNKRILFVGGNQGMGLAAAKITSSLGAEIIVSSRNETKLKEIVKEEFGGKAKAFSCDASDPENVRKMLQTLQPISDIVVTATGPRVSASSILKTSTELAHQAFQGFWIAYNIVHTAKEYMQRNGSITLISGSSAKTPGDGWGFWGVSQGSINLLVRFGSLELAPIRLNAVSPGGIGVRNPDRQLTEHRGTYEDVGQMIVALIANPHITGTIVDVDGGERQGQWNG
jgi:NAD(P)-dependent dehydrogenase (short-subunit alcohol dehydrogenase family)